MVSYAVLMFLMAVLFLVLGVLIFRGRTDLIHSYHQKKVKDQRAYGRDIGKAIFAFSAAMTASGAVALVDEAVALIAIVVLVFGMGVGVGMLCAVQKKHNGGLF